MPGANDNESARPARGESHKQSERRFRCVTCDRSVRYAGPIPELYPFCSARCRMVDLGKWFNEQYGVETVPKPEDLDLIQEPDDEATVRRRGR